MPGRRSGRAAAKRAAAALESTPKTWEGLDDDDEAMPDADAEDEQTPNPEDEETKEESAAGDFEEAPEEEERVPTPPPQPQLYRKKRLGRPPKIKPPDWDLPVEPNPRDSDSTPRRRGRGGWRGRGGRKGAPAPITQQAIDKEGSMVDIKNDELDLPEDPEGETKVDKMGHLQGDREYRCRTFTVQGRGDRLYMLSTEPARCVGFRDSYLFFAKHKRLYKSIVDDEEKRDMIEREIIPHSYKGRSIGIVTARSVFREFGALIVVGGRRIIDDYDLKRAREEGFNEGDLADPNDQYNPTDGYNKNQYVAWHGASSVYHTNAPAPAAQNGPQAPARNRRVAVNDVNWQYEHAHEAATFNAQINALRRMNNRGVYDVHTNTIQYPAIMQPTNARIVQVEPSGSDSSEETSQVFPTLQPSIARNFMVTDTYFETPPAGISHQSYETNRVAYVADKKAHGSDFLAPFHGLNAMSAEILAELPPECREAFDKAAANERSWHSKWGTEKETKSRRDPVIDKAIVPYSRMK